MKKRLKFMLPAAVAMVALLGAVMLPAQSAKANAIGLYVGSCVGGGYSYYYSAPAEIGTYELYNNGSCQRGARRSWLTSGSWQNWGWEYKFSDWYYPNYGASAARGQHQMLQGFSGVQGSSCSFGAGACGTW